MGDYLPDSAAEFLYFLRLQLRPSALDGSSKTCSLLLQSLHRLPEIPDLVRKSCLKRGVIMTWSPARRRVAAASANA